MKIVSLLPSGTEILCELGLEDELAGVTDVCDYPPSVREKRVVCRSLFNPAQLTSAEVEDRMQSIQRDGSSPFVLDMEQIRREEPDLIIAQDLCYRCSPDSAEVARLCDVTGLSSKILTLHPTTLRGIFDSIFRIGYLTGRSKEAILLVGQLRDRIDRVSKIVATTDYRPRVFSVEGVNPLVVGGNWLPEMKALAGGIDNVFAPGFPARRIPWSLVIGAEPEVFIIALCSSPMSRSVREAMWLTRQEGWSSLPAVRNNRVYVAEHVYFSRPGPRIVVGLELLVRIFHPEVFGWTPPSGSVRLFHPDMIEVDQ